MKNIIAFLKEMLFTTNSDDELFEMGVVTPRKARDPITQTRLKAMAPPNEDLARRQAETREEIESADEAGVVHKHG